MPGVVVIGGGLIGAAAACQVARTGASVTLVDRGERGQATAAGAGIISPTTSVGENPAYFPLAGLAPTSAREWRIGFRPLSRDGLPYLGRLPGTENVCVATGHGPSGLQPGAYSAAAVADEMLGRTPDFDLSPYRPGRG